MKAISNNNLARAIYGALKEKSPAEEVALMPKIVEFLARKRLLAKAPDILSRLNKIINTAEGKMAAKVYSAERLSEADKKDISESLSKKYAGKEIILEDSLDEKLIGGIKIEINDEIIDLSIKNRIKK